MISKFCCGNCFTASFWPVSGVLFILVTSILVAFELPWSTVDPVTPNYGTNEINDEMKKRAFVQLEPADSEAINYEKGRIIAALARAAIASEDIFREQYVREWNNIVDEMMSTRDYYEKHYDSKLAQKDKLDLFNALIYFYDVNRGPYDIINNSQAFITQTHRASFPDNICLGHNFYPDTMDKEEWNSLIDDNQKVREKLQSKCDKIFEDLQGMIEDYAKCEEENPNNYETECSSKKKIMDDKQMEFDEAVNNLDEFNEEEAKLLLPYTVVGKVPNNEFSMSYESFSYDIEYEEKIAAVLKELETIQTQWLQGQEQEVSEYFNRMMKIYSKITPNDESEEVNKGDNNDLIHQKIGLDNESYTEFSDYVKDATVHWCKMIESNLEFLFGPYNFGFDSLNGVKGSWCAYVGIVDRDIENITTMYTGELKKIERYKSLERYLPNIRPIDVLVEQEGKVAPPKTLSFTFPTLGEIFNDDYLDYGIQPKSYILVNEINYMYDMVMKILADKLGFESKDYKQAYQQIFLSLEPARLTGLITELKEDEEDGKKLYVVTSETYAINYVKSILSGIHDIYDVAKNMANNEPSPIKGLFGYVNKYGEDGDKPYYKEFTEDVFKMVLTQLIYLLQFGEDSTYSKYSNIVLKELQKEGVLKFNNDNNKCVINIVQGFSDEDPKVLNIIGNLTSKLAKIEQGGDPQDIFPPDGAALDASCFHIFSDDETQFVHFNNIRF